MTVMDHRPQTTTLELTTVVDHDITHLTVSGDIDLATADDLTAAGNQALTRPGVSILVINMAAVTFMSASGVGALVSIQNNARRHDQVVVVGGAARCVSRMLELTSLTDQFRLTGVTQNLRASGGRHLE
jgi:anti-sigma B factor antagonist